MPRWPYPDLRNGTTVNLFTDSHWGNANQAYENRGAQIMRDMESLRVTHACHVHSGDLIDWGGADEQPEDALWVSWRDKLKTLDGQPWLEVPGNHDLSDFTSNQWRTSLDWARAVGKTDFNTVEDVGDLRVIGLGPDYWLPGDLENPPTGAASGFVLSDATLSWLEDRLSETTRPCILVTHITPIEYDSTVPFPIQPESKFSAIVGSHSNVVAHLSGHYHRTVVNTNTAKSVAIGGRNILCVNGPAAGGRMAGVAFADYDYKSPAASLWITMLDEKTWDIRTRIHTTRSWQPGNGNPFIERVTIP